MLKFASGVLAVLERVVKLYCPNMSSKIMSYQNYESKSFSELTILHGTKGIAA